MIIQKIKSISSRQGHFGLKLIPTINILKSGNHALNINPGLNQNEQIHPSKFKYIPITHQV
jgi:hypothetical protein